MEASPRTVAEDEALLAEKLFNVISGGRESAIERYLSFGADPNLTLVHGHSAFHLAAGCERSLEFARLILKYGGNPNVRNSEGQTPLHIATSWGRLQCMMLLVKHGADVNLKDHDGKGLMEFAKENGSEECVALAKKLLVEGQQISMINTPKSIKPEYRTECSSIGKENETPNTKFSNDSPLGNIPSPLRDDFDDSWIVKKRGGSERRRRRVDSGKISAGNSPINSPMQTHQKNFKNTSCSPCCKKSCERQQRMENDIVLACPCSFPRMGQEDYTCCVSTAPRPCCGALQMPYILTPLNAFLPFQKCNPNKVLDTENNDVVTRDKCIGTSLLDPCGNITPVKIVRDSSTIAGVHIAEDVEIDTTDKCIGTSMLASHASIGGFHAVGDVEFETTDKCIGTSMLASHASAGSVSCQVTMNEDTEELMKGVKNLHMPSPLPEPVTVTAETEKTVSKHQSCDSSSQSTTMEDFLKGCDRFIDSQNKGLDVSSPDNCVSFMLPLKSISNSPCSALAQKHNKPEEIVPEYSSAEKEVLLVNIPDTDSHPNPIGGKANCLRQTCSGNCMNTGNLQIPASVPHSNVLPLTNSPPQEIAAKTVDLSPNRNMLLSTKVPLTQSEMVQLFGEDVLAENEPREDVKTIEVRPNSSPATQVPIARDENKETASVPSSVTFSDSTVRLDSNSNLEKTSNSPSTPEHSSVSLRKFASSEKSRTSYSSKSTSSPPQMAQSSISLRKFAASNSEQSCTNMDVSKTKDSLKLFDNCNDLVGKKGLAAPNTRLHSTALTDGLDDLHFTTEESFDISIIKASGEIVSKMASQGDEVFIECSDGDQSPLQTVSKSVHTCDQALSDGSSQSTIIYNWKTFWRGEPLSTSSSNRKRKGRKKAKSSETSDTSEASCDETPLPITVEDIDSLSNLEIRNKLVSLGYNPGPINACREMYVKKLELFCKNGLRGREENAKQSTNTSIPAAEPKFSTELHRYILGISLPESVMTDDEEIRQQFEQPDPDIQWREGTLKSSFTYLLLDPRVTDRLPIRAKSLSGDEVFKSFVGAIFYVGKGKQSRPYSHFHEAMQTNILHYKLNPSRKIRHIHDIWDAGLGVISLHVFQSVIACEAYTREAAMIESIGLAHLTNLKKGEYYGIAARWNLPRKRRYGAYLVKKAMDVLMVEGERQIRPSNLRSHNTRQWSIPKSPVVAK